MSRRTLIQEPPRRRVPRAEREQQILDAAEAVFAERGVRAASMEEIAERVGVTKPMIYEYFGSKDGLVVACVSRSRAQLLEMTVRATEGVTDPEEEMRRGLRAFFDFVTLHAGWAVLRNEAVLATGPAAAAVTQSRDQHTAHTADVLAAYPHLADVDPVRLRAYAEVVVGACERLAFSLDGIPGLDAAGATEVVMEVLWAGLGRPTEPTVSRVASTPSAGA